MVFASVVDFFPIAIGVFPAQVPLYGIMSGVVLDLG